ncbi:hypothetical protein CYY_009151 [Polysphondylium violaceum]|uniref:Phospholipase B-like n=1 Tax=Polysphondylium violaceum TaxID=133409 RepID=A0A8J4UPQ3_9MYCE|nr:hypothetical protein CYY_009151 [Polysphondylium violaceum]
MKSILLKLFLLFLVIENSFCIKINVQDDRIKFKDESFDKNNKQFDSNIQTYSIVFKQDDSGICAPFSVVNGVDKNAIAIANYQGDLSINGWAYLSINTSSSYNDTMQAAAAGFLEGFLTYQHTWDSKVNYYTNQFQSNSIPSKILDWILINIQFMRESIKNEPDSIYWKHIELTLTQIEYMVFGHNEAVGESNQEKSLQLADFFILNMFGDLFDLVPALNLTDELTYYKKDLNNIEDYFSRAQHCSALVKLTADLGELFAGHTTWNSFSTQVRILKSYTFGFSLESGIKSRSILFSSYPGVLISIDDFYQLDTELVILETTNSLITNDLYHLIQPKSVLSWLRIMNANRLSTDGATWCTTFALYNSGTYNNQYIIIDYKKFTPYKELRDGALYVIEQIPLLVEYSDETDLLRISHFPSYNIPFFENIYNLSGYNTFKYPKGSQVEFLSYQAAPRAEIFRRDASKIATIQDFQNLLRYNDWQNDPLSHNNPSYSISARRDLTPSSVGNATADGGLDCKVTSYSLLQQGKIYAIGGPTYQQQPVFQWSTSAFNLSVSHQGQPDVWKFDWFEYTSTTFNPITNE